MFSVMLIVSALMRNNVVAVRQRKNGTEYRFTLCHFGADGTICQLNDCGHVCYYRNIYHVFAVLKRKLKSVSYDAAIIDDLREEQEFLAGREAAAKLIDPPPFLKLAA